MGTTNALHTATTNFLELIGNGKTYKAPPYQRDYAWTEAEWDDLWNDILELRQNPDTRHYMGALVVQAKTDREFVVIDGQQRLATISILALAVIDRLQRMAEQGMDPAQNRERAQELRNRFIGEKDPASLIERSRLALNKTDDGFYQDYLVQIREPRNPRGLPGSNKLLHKCFAYFSDAIERLADLREDGVAVARLLSETVARKLLFILVTVEDEMNAYTVFETLNARGLELTTTDLLKNYLFSKVKTAADLRVLQRRWQTLIAVVAQERFTEFLRYHLLCERPQIRKERLFKVIRERISDTQEVFALLDALENRGEMFASFFDPDHGDWAELREAKPFVRELVLFRTQQATPLLFAARERFSDKDFVRVLKLANAISFRYAIVGRLNPNKLELAYHGAAKAILDGKATTPAEVFDRLRTIYVTDAQFMEHFAAFSVSMRRRKLVKYILCKLEKAQGGADRDPETDPGSIEHILPANPTQDWAEAFGHNQLDAATERIGNLTLLEPAKNRDISHAPFAEKRAAYATSAYALTQRIPDIAPEEWTFALLEERQKRLAQWAVTVWRSDFA